MRKSKNTTNPTKITEKESRKKTASDIKIKITIFIPQSKTTMSEDSSAKSIKLKTTIQPLKATFHLNINTTANTMKGHSKEVALT
jgi:hypothetical protein